MKNSLPFLLLFVTIIMHGQDTTLSESVKQSLEWIAENNVELSLDQFSGFDNLDYFKKHPLPINTCTAAELASLHLLNTLQIHQLLKHRRESGSLIAYEELQVIEGFDTALIRLIKPYLRFDTEDGIHSWVDFKEKTEHNLSCMLQRKAGISSAQYPDRIQLRYRAQCTNQLRMCLMADKDPGESLKGSNQKVGFDFYTGHLALKNNSGSLSCVLGDFQLAFGQGLAMCTVFGLNKTTDPLCVKRNATGITANTSMNEYRFFRGLAGSWKKEKVALSVFYSHKKADAILAQVFDKKGEKNIVIKSIDESGYHASPAAMARRKNVLEQCAGINLEHQGNNYSLGVNVCANWFNYAFAHGSALYQYYKRDEEWFGNASVYYDVRHKNSNCFGEAAFSQNGKLAIVNGLLFGADRRMTYSLAHRYYAPAYFAPWASAFGEQSGASNEQGIFQGLSLLLKESLSLGISYDYYLFPWLKGNADAPSQGYDYTLQLNYSPRRSLQAYLRYRHINREQNCGVMGGKTNVLEEEKKDNVRLNVSCQLSSSFQFHNRLEMQMYSTNRIKADGFFVCQDVGWQPGNSRFSCWIRYALYDSDDYKAAIYAYENDFPFVYSIPAYNGNGAGMAVMLRYRVYRKLECWIKWSSSFSSVISNQTKTESDMKVMWRWNG